VLNISKKILSVIVVILYILTPLVFLQYKNGYILSIPFILALLEPIKVKYLMEQDIADIIGRNVKLFIISFLLLFISGIICKMVHIEKSQYVYGGLFYLILAHLDFKEYQKNY
jgi:hypothetical protein